MFGDHYLEFVLDSVLAWDETLEGYGPFCDLIKSISHRLCRLYLDYTDSIDPKHDSAITIINSLRRAGSGASISMLCLCSIAPTTLHCFGHIPYPSLC